MVDLARLEQLLAEATDGPWYIRDESPWVVDSDTRSCVAYGGPPPPDPNPVHAEKDAALIVEAVNSLPALIETAKAAKDLKAAMAPEPYRWRKHVLCGRCNGLGIFDETGVTP